MPVYDLIEWNKKWRITDDSVICRACNAVQRYEDRSGLFAHAPECFYAGQNSRPWESLDRILNKPPLTLGNDD
jgi:hypothetical protein